ncbi:MAG: Flp family type IVb pilin [Alphaproteobacteria bacterium]|nr:Flp family type IVb pilin [Alphaproteobacteria bacterium]
METFARFIENESGATAIEYGLIAALIAVVVIGAVTAVGTGLSSTFNTVAGSVK